jgi:hypothetical protein
MSGCQAFRVQTIGTFTIELTTKSDCFFRLSSKSNCYGDKSAFSTHMLIDNNCKTLNLWSQTIDQERLSDCSQRQSARRTI